MVCSNGKLATQPNLLRVYDQLFVTCSIIILLIFDPDMHTFTCALHQSLVLGNI